ncbi:Pectinesterase PPME1 [Acorus gramineus]|uniref:pectinesterase n=1 Tax=Acorus gramineus TaxID=55184 RepID=A0AAV9AY42_ACOGR|nr:Pectinesterase PPME1 [Acorus gramineus]
MSLRAINLNMKGKSFQNRSNRKNMKTPPSRRFQPYIFPAKSTTNIKHTKKSQQTMALSPSLKATSLSLLILLQLLHLPLLSSAHNHPPPPPQASPPPPTPVSHHGYGTGGGSHDFGADVGSTVSAGFGQAIGMGASVSADLNGWISANVHTFEDVFAHSIFGHGVGALIEPLLMLAENGKQVLTVRQDGTGQFRTITDAIASVPQTNGRRIVIKVGAGVYKEAVIVDRPFITLCGDPFAMPTIAFDGKAGVSAALHITADFFVASNLIFENTAWASASASASVSAGGVACRVSGDKAAFFNCKFNGNQNTLWDEKGNHYFKDCFIQGSIDFLFGLAKSLFEHCQVHLVKSVSPSVHVGAGDGVGAGLGLSSLIGALASVGGSSFVHCSLVGSLSSYADLALKLGARVVFAFCYLGGSLVPNFGSDGKSTSSSSSPSWRTPVYGEYKCMGPGSSGTGGLGKALTDTQAAPFLGPTFLQASKWLLPPVQY